MGVQGAEPLEAPETLQFAMLENRQKCMLVANVLLYTANTVTGKILIYLDLLREKIGGSPMKTHDFHHFFEKYGL